MMPFLLLFLGLLLILIEFYVPGAVMGIVGSILVVISIILFASQSSSPVATFLFFLVAAVAVGLMIRFALWRIVHAKPERSIYSAGSQDGYQASSYEQTAIGKKGLVLSDLRPGGYILIENRQHPAISVSGYIEKDTEVIVIGGQGESLIVKPSKKEERS